jgi:hypothetical protein
MAKIKPAVLPLGPPAVAVNPRRVAAVQSRYRPEKPEEPIPTDMQHQHQRSIRVVQTKRFVNPKLRIKHQ